MAIPDFQSCMRPLLSAIADGKVHHFLDAFSKVCDFFKLNEDERALKLPSGKQTVIKNRVGWSRTYLKKAGLLIQPERGFIQITELGLKALEECPDRVNVKYLKQFEAFKAFHTHTTDSDQILQPDNNDAEENTDPTERLEQAYSELQNELASELLDTLKQQSPQFLENVVVELMQAMGYGGWSQDSGKATQYSNDGGKDGIINEDPLGLDAIYLQVKRYSDNTVGRPDVQSFVGALEMKRARKGVFITTSKFSNDAVEYIQMIEKKVVLIDGQKLAELMIQHDLGVSSKACYKVKTIDSDYFSGD